jgi:hypothetical protein
VEGAGIFRGKGEYEHATGGTVESVYGVNPLTDCIARKIECECGALVVTAMNGDAGWLVDDDHGVILVENVDRRRDGRGARRAWVSRDDRLAPPQSKGPIPVEKPPG